MDEDEDQQQNRYSIRKQKVTFLNKHNEKIFGEARINKALSILDLENLDRENGEDNALNLDGKIPSQRSTLMNLKYFDASCNEWDGEIPHQLYELKNLTHLDLSYNDFECEIPPQLFTLKNLTHLDLSKSFLTGTIPSEIGKLQNLTHLNISIASLKGAIPSQFWKLKNLTYLNLGYNSRLEGKIPSDIKNLLHLNYLNIAGNAITEIDFTHCSFDNVEVHIDNNPLISFSPPINGMLKLSSESDSLDKVNRETVLYHTNICFDCSAIKNSYGLQKLLFRVLQNNVVCATKDRPLRIQLFELGDQLSDYLQPFFGNSATNGMIIKYPNGLVDVEGIPDKLKKDEFISIMNTFID